MRREYDSGSKWEKYAGYVRAVQHGNVVYVSGTTGFDYQRHTISEDPIEQTAQCFKNIDEALSQFGLDKNDVVRVRYYVKSGDIFEKVSPLFGKYFSENRPAATAIICDLIDERMKIEIELSACVES